MNNKVIPFPVQQPVAGEENALWFIAISNTFKDEYSCEYKDESGFWYIRVKSSTFSGVAALVKQCRHTMGWSQSVNSKETTETLAENEK